MRVGRDHHRSRSCRYAIVRRSRRAPTVLGDGEVVGRVNLVDLIDGAAELGYRIAERAAGRGLATSAVRRSVGSRLWARVRRLRPHVGAGRHCAGQPRVAGGAHPGGFVLAESVELDGQPEVRFVRDLTLTERPADRWVRVVRRSQPADRWQADALVSHLDLDRVDEHVERSCRRLQPSVTYVLAQEISRRELDG